MRCKISHDYLISSFLFYFFWIGPQLCCNFNPYFGLLGSYVLD